MDRSTTHPNSQEPEAAVWRKLATFITINRHKDQLAICSRVQVYMETTTATLSAPSQGEAKEAALVLAARLIAVGVNANDPR